MSGFTVRPVAAAETRQLRRSVLRPHQSLHELAGHEPPDAYAVGAFSGPELVAVGLVGLEGGERAWRIRGMATLPQARGRGAGSRVLSELVSHARAGGAARVWCNVRIAARSLYERAGFRVISEEFELPEIGPHLVMELTIASDRAPVVAERRV